MNTETGRRSSAKFHADRKAAGWRKVTVWLTPDAAFRVDALKGAVGSADEVVRQAIMSWPGPGSVLKIGNEPIYPDLEPGHTTNKVTAIQLGPVEPKPGSRLKVKR